jgi:hypothetical protein
MYLAWVVGFITGSNGYAAGRDRLVGEHWDPNSTLLWLENYCFRTPATVQAASLHPPASETLNRSGRRLAARKRTWAARTCLGVLSIPPKAPPA